MLYQSIQISIEDLFLDVDNPRFILPQKAEQIDLIKYLLNYEEISQLANGISKSGGLSAGERIIVIRSGEKYVVLEGNRRVCACKLLLHRELIPQGIAIPYINDNVRENISLIDVDLVESRDAIQSVLYRRHINGVKDWSPISKLKFCAAQFDNGMSIEDIAALMSAKPGHIRKDLRNYKLVNYALSLPEWGRNNLAAPDIYKIKITYFTHALEISWNGIPNMQTGFSLLKLTCDDSTKFNVTSSLPPDIFAHATFLIAKAAFYDGVLTTRNCISDIKEITDYLSQKKIINIPDAVPDADTDNTSSIRTSLNAGQSNGKISTAGDGQTGSPKSAIPCPAFFDNLTCNALSAGNPEHNGLLVLAYELKEISLRNYYEKYPVASAMLLRALLEQSFEYYLKKKNELDNLMKYLKEKRDKSKEYEPTLSNMVDFLNSKNGAPRKRIFTDKTIQTAFASATTQEMINFFNTNIHNTCILRATKQDLERRASSCGLFALINYILNDK